MYSIPGKFWLRAMTLLAFFSVVFSGIARANLEGTYRMSQDVWDSGRRARLTYTLSLRGGGRAELVTERNSYIRNVRQVADDYGSIATVYLQGRNRVSHTGNWKESNDHVNITLTSINGRQDKAFFFGDYHDGRLRLNTSNRGMYGRSTHFELSRDGGKISNKDAIAVGAAAVVLGAIIAEESRKDRVERRNDNKDGDREEDIQGKYAFTQQVDEDGGIRYQLRLEQNGDAVLIAERTGEPSTSYARVQDFGEVLRMVSRDDSTRHRGRFKRDGDRIEIELDDFTIRSGFDDENSSKKVTLRGRISGSYLRLEIADGESLYGKRTRFEFRR